MNQRRAVAFASTADGFLRDPVDRDYVVSVNHNRWHAVIPRSLRRAYPEAVLNHINNRQFVTAGKCKCVMRKNLAWRVFGSERHHDLGLLLPPASQSCTRGQTEPFSNRTGKAEDTGGRADLCRAQPRKY